MRDELRGVEVRVITSYVAAVAAAVAVFFAGEALDASLHPVSQPDGLPLGITEASFAFLTAFLLVLVVALVPVLIGLAAFRWARVSHPGWFLVYGTGTGLLVADLFRDLAAGFLVPAVAGAAGGLVFRAIMGRAAEPPDPAEVRHEAPSPAASHRARLDRLADHDAQAAYVSDALASDDPALVVFALKEIGTLRRVPVALDENPPLGEILRALRDLGLKLAALPAMP